MMRILVADDEKNIREALVKILKQSGWDAEAVGDGAAAQQRLQEEPFSAVVADLKMPGLDGLQLLQWCRQYGPDIPFVMISAHGEIQDAVEAMKRGARDYLTKPFDPDELEFRVKQAMEAHRDQRVALSLKNEAVRKRTSQVSRSPQWNRVEQILQKAAPTNSLILITGESGSGKEVLAKRIHEMSPNALGPFVAINMGGIPENLLESELFGYEKGAFTGADHRKTGLFEMAAGGTLFLDEIGEIPPTLQVKLLRVLQERKIQRLGGTIPIPIEARILAATNRNLGAEVKAGRFREDLFYRLNVVPISLPPLRERLEDLEWLCTTILEKLCRTMGRNSISLGQQALDRLKRYDFPGNIRELENLLERALIFCEDASISSEDLDLPGIPVNEVALHGVRTGTLHEVEKRTIQECLQKWEGNQTRAAEELGVSRRTLFNKIREYELN